MEVKRNLQYRDFFKDILDYLDPEIGEALKKLPKYYRKDIEEVRLRVGKPLMLNIRGNDLFIDKDGIPSSRLDNKVKVSKDNIIKSFRLLCNYSVYAVEEEIKNGFITIKGGHRVGITGKAVYGNNGLETLKEVSSLNIRISKQMIGISNKVLPYIVKNSSNIYHTLIISAPQCGKTTLLRDIIRSISDGIKEINFKGLKVGVVDERSEIAGMFRGIPQNDIGLRTDILDGCSKYDGIIMLIRSMSPHVIATDEIGGKKDISAIHEALKAGVKIIATVHGEGLEDIKTKPNLKKIIDEKIFERLIILDNSKGVGTVSDVIDGKTFKSLI